MPFHYLYVIQAGNGPVKIGITNSITERLASLQTAHYEELRPVYFLECDTRDETLALERLLHKRYERFHVRGEWFSIPADIVESDLLLAVEFAKTLGEARLMTDQEMEGITEQAERIESPPRPKQFIPQPPPRIPWHTVGVNVNQQRSSDDE